MLPFDFQTSTTSEKLRFLADNLEKPELAARFDQVSSKNCTVALGAILQANGKLAENMWGGGAFPIFQTKYKVGWSVAFALYTGRYSMLGIGEPDYVGNNTPVEDVKKILRKLADRYEETQELYDTLTETPETNS
jgi:hypothetical protein